MRTLTLRREYLAELTTRDLREIVAGGGDETQSCTCVTIGCNLVAVAGGPTTSECNQVSICCRVED